MDLTVNGYGQSFGNGKLAPVSKAKSAVDILVKDGVTGIIYKILPEKPQYMYASEKKVIQYPVLINGTDTMYNVRYPYSQNHINRVGYEMTEKKGLDLQLLSAREIAKDIENKQKASISKTIAIG